jgi:hypothetical protein
MRYQELCEARAMIRGIPVLLLRNPSPELLFFHIGGFRQGIARGLLVGNDAYFWDAYLATHADIEDFLGMEISNEGFDIAEREEGFAFAAPDGVLARAQNNRAVQKILSDPRVEIA